jgi:serine/threonine protein kinase
MKDFLGSEQLTEWDTRVGLMKDIANGLNALHALSTEIKFSNGSHAKLKMFHMDLKPSNILVRRQNGQLTAAITDFGMAGSYTKRGGSLGYKAPEEARLEQRGNLTDTMVEEHNTLYGQAMNVWALGLLFMDLAVNKPLTFLDNQKPTVFTQLPCIHECIFNAQGTNSFVLQPSLDNKKYDIFLASLEQKQVDLSINKIRAQESLTGFQPGQANVWDLILLMLRVNPEERMFVKNITL